MKRDHLTPAEISAYHARRLPAADALAASDHLIECDECRTRLQQLDESVAGGAPSAARKELSYEELAVWLDDELDPMSRREVAATLAHSPQARAELADLAKFRAEMNDLPARDYSSDELPAPETAAPHMARGPLALAATLVLSGAAIWWMTSAERDAADVVKLRDAGREIVFAQDGRAAVFAQLPAEARDDVAQTIRSGRIDLTPDVVAMIGQRGTLAGAGEEEKALSVLEPVGTAVRDPRPRFRWTAAPEASTYQVNVVEETSGSLIVTQQLPSDVTEWQPPAPLVADEVYQWEVQAVRDGTVVANSPKPPEPEARFRILSAAKLIDLDELKRASNGSHLVMGVAYARVGLIDDALREFRALSEQNPDAELPRRLLQQLEAQRRASL